MVSFCNDCQKEKPVSEFYFGSKAKCKECKIKQQRGKDRNQVNAPNASKKEFPTFVCQKCGAVFPNRHGKLRKYCSRECVTDALTKRKVFKCCICSKDVLRKPSQNTGNRICCSRECSMRLSRRLNRTAIKRAVKSFKSKLIKAFKPARWASVQAVALKQQYAISNKSKWEKKSASIAGGMRLRPARKQSRRVNKSESWDGKAARLRRKARWHLSDSWKKWAVNTASNQSKRIRRFNERNRNTNRKFGQETAVQMQFDWS